MCWVDCNKHTLHNMLDTAPMVLVLYHLVGLARSQLDLAGFQDKGLGGEWKAVLLRGYCGWRAHHLLLEPIAGMTIRRCNGVIPAPSRDFSRVKRGQYEKASPSDVSMIQVISSCSSAFWSADICHRVQLGLGVRCAGAAVVFFQNAKTANAPGSSSVAIIFAWRAADGAHRHCRRTTSRHDNLLPPTAMHIR